MNERVLAMEPDLPLKNQVSIIEVPPPDENTKWENLEYGIRDLSAFSDFDERGLLEKTANFGQTIFHGAVYTVTNLNKHIKERLNALSPSKFDEDTLIGKDGSHGLAIFLHGLNGHPSLWDEHIAYFLSHTEIDVIAPEIPEQGNCDMQGANFIKFLDRIVDWTKRNPTKPITFFGQSNGTLVAALFEVWLREKAPKTPVYVSLSGPVLFGSKMVSQLKPLLDFAANLRFDFNVFSVLDHESNTVSTLLAKVREPLGEGVAERHYVMYAPFHDHYVYSLGSALPILNPSKQATKKERHYIIFNYGHNAIPTGILGPQIDKCIKWMRKMAGANRKLSDEQICYYNNRKIYQDYLKLSKPSWAHKPIDEFIYPKGIFKDNRPMLEACIQPLIACAQGIFEVCRKKISYPGAELAGQLNLANSSGLIVLLHGLNDGPVQWSQALEELRTYNNGYFNNFTIYIPTLPARGNSDVKTISKPVGEIISKFFITKGNENKPIIFIGTSNGGRLALHLSNIFASTKNLFVASIAGAHFGTEALSIANEMGLSFITAIKDIQRDLDFGSEHSKETINAAQDLHKNQPNHAFLFFSSNTDAVVQALEYHPSHPKIKVDRVPTRGPAVKHVQVAGVGHLSIPSAVILQILVDVEKWIASGCEALDPKVEDIKSTPVDYFLE